MTKKQGRGLPHSNRRGTARHPTNQCPVCEREFKTARGMQIHCDAMHRTANAADVLSLRFGGP